MKPPDAQAATTNPLAEALGRLARGTPTALAAVLHDVESHVVIEGTNVTVHCHCLKLDGNGRPRIEDLVKAVTEYVLEYAIPRSQIAEAYEEHARTGSSRKVMRVANEARALFTDLEQSGEGGELLLFALAETVLRLPQLICKMSLKTNARMHFHGADGLHAGVDPATGKLLLYWGESKIYEDVTAAVRECLASITPMLSDNSAGQRDLQLLQRHMDLDDEDLEKALKKFLDPDAQEFNSLEFRGLCLVGFDCDLYPKGPSSAEVTALATDIAKALLTWKGHVKKRITEQKLDAFAIHFLFVPFPSAEGFRTLVREVLGFGKPSAAAASTPAVSPVPASAAVRATGTRRATPVPQGSKRPPRASKTRGNPSGAA